MPSPAPCPTPQGCPNPEPCSEVMDAQCIIYTGENIICDTEVVVTTNNTVAQALNNIVDYVCANQPTVPAYKVYTALLTQTAEDIPTNPIVTVLENTIGNIIWTRVNAGQYVGTLSGAFVSAKTALFIQKSVGLAKIQITPKDLWIEYTNANTITIYTTGETFLIDGVLNNTTVEIRVYN
jgi:hypothetical protein